MMKKNLPLATLCIFALLFLATKANLFAQETARRITYEAVYTSVAPVIDGFEDPIWQTANEGLMDQIVEGDATSANGTFRILWDEEFLYFLIQVNDPIRSAWDFESENVNPWMYDNVEIFIGPANHPETEYLTGDHQYRFTPGIPGLYNPWADPREIDEDVEFAENDEDTHYIFEIAWPWEHIVRDSLELLSEIVNGKIMEFEIQFADNNTPGEPIRDNVVAWNNDTDDGNSWNNTDLWGFLKLVGGPDNEGPSRRITYEAVYTATAPIIDGFEDPIWETANEGLMDQIVEGEETTANGNFRILWDEEFLYFYIQVNDPIRSAWDFESEEVNPWMYDNVEIFIGPANHSQAEYGTGDHQYRFTPGIPGLYNPWTDPREIDEDVEFAENDEDTHYIFEIAWPWEHIVRDSLELLNQIVNGKIMEFEIQFADNNTPGQPIRDNVVAWNNDSDDGNSWNNTLLWGFLKLTGGPTNVENIVQQNQIRVFPNPARNMVTIQSSSPITEVYLTNMIGQTVLNKKFNTNDLQSTIDLSAINTAGIYFINILTETGLQSQKIVISR